jgi:hypothetical protein
MTAMSEPKPTKGVAIAAPLDVTCAGVLEEGVGRVIAAVEEGPWVVPGADAEVETTPEDAAPEEGATGGDGCGVSLLKDTETVDGADEAGGAGGGAEADETGGTSTEETGAGGGGGAYELPGRTGAGVPHSLTVTVTVAGGGQVAANDISLRCIVSSRKTSRSIAMTAQTSTATANSLKPNMMTAVMCMSFGMW